MPADLEAIRRQLTDAGSIADLAGHQIYVRRFTPPEGPPTRRVLFVHGIGGFSYIFIPLVERLRELGDAGTEFVLFDWMGRGLSSQSLACEHRASDYVGVLRALVDYLWADGSAAPLTIVGHSLGGMVTCLFAGEHPQLVSRVVLLSPAGLNKRPIGAAVLASWFGRLVAPAIPAYDPRVDFRDKKHPRLPFYVDHYNAGAGLHPQFGRIFQRCVERLPLFAPGIQAEAAKLNQTDIDVAIVWGKQDPTLPVKALDAWLEIIPRATSRVVEGSHIFFIEDSLEETCEAIGRGSA